VLTRCDSVIADYLSSKQKHQLGYEQAPLPESDPWLDSLNEDYPSVSIEKKSLQISKICERARYLHSSLEDTNLSFSKTLDLVKEMQDLDKVATTWRSGPEWAYKTIPRSETIRDEDEAAIFPELIQLHRDVWIAYEWNYHRTARIILHEHLLVCLHRLESSNSELRGANESDLLAFKRLSVATVEALVDEVLSTVPQSLGDINHDGSRLESSTMTSKCRGVGGYFLLWPIKVIKRTKSATEQQRATAQYVFERIRKCTGMRSTLGELSSI
jgi:hypothetical protein